MADEMNPSDKIELLSSNVDSLDITFGTIGFDGNLQILYIEGTRKKCQAKITLGNALDAVVEIPLKKENLDKINSQISKKGLSKEDIKKIVAQYGIRKGTELLLQGYTKEALLEGKISGKEEGKEKE